MLTFKCQESRDFPMEKVIYRNAHSFTLLIFLTTRIGNSKLIMMMMGLYALRENTLYIHLK